MNRGATRTGVDQADSRSTGNIVRSAAHTSTATARLTERWRSSRQGHLMTRHGSHQPCTSGTPKSSRGFKFQKGPPRFPAIRPEQRRRKKKTAPEGRLEKWRPCWGQRWAAMYLNEPAKRRFRAPTKKDGMPVPSSEFGSALWLGPRQPATHPCAWAHYESPGGAPQCRC